MPFFLKTAGILSVLAFVLCLFLGLNGYISRQYIAVPLGFVFASVALEALVSRRDLRDARGGPARAGSLRWKAALLLFWGLGVLTLLMGASPFLARLSGAGRWAVAFGAVALVMTVAVVILRVKKIPFTDGEVYSE